MKTGLMLGIVVDPKSKTRVRCVYCGVYIPKANKCIEQHTNGTKHKENNELMSENGIQLKDDVLYCKLCKSNLSVEDSVSKHIEMEYHANWMAAADDLTDGEFINLESFLSTESSDVHCEACNTTFDCSLKNIQEHVNQYDHRASIVERLKPLNGIFTSENEYEAWCKVCDDYVDNTVQGVLGHIDDDERHMEWFTEIEDLIEEQEVSIKKYLTVEHELNAYCNQCQVEIPCNAQSLQDHVNSDSHLNSFSS